MQIYIVKPNDTVDSIAAEHGIFVSSILYNNQLSYPYALAVGQALLLSVGEPSENRRSIYTNGYAYPFINPDILSETLPYLTSVSIFSYGFTSEGVLIPPLWDDTWIIAAAKSQHTAPILVLTPFGPDGQFNNYLITQVVNSPEATAALIDNLLFTITEKGYEGVDVDFEYILPEDRIAFANFVSQIRQAVNTLGYPVSVALAPKIADDQPGLLYEGKDYALLGEAADSVLLMTYEWGYTYGPPMAVAPISQVRRVVEYALTRIPAEKIDLGIPNYGYDWPLPYERGITKAITLGNIEAVQIAIENSVPIQFDQTAMSPFFTYERDTVSHEVWFEDVRSMQEKFSLVETYNLRGVGYWQIMKLFLANWLLLSDRFLLRKT